MEIYWVTASAQVRTPCKVSMKACMASLKYAWMFTLATGDDSEVGFGVDQRMSEPSKIQDLPAARSGCGATITPGVLQV